ncbi:hypothetical protein Scep_006330 [Stephania cephalantha]|uniref:Pentatricopeptide repeat-containing protein n=1 Tax=Stephania cephalantha TaxID=152367 RepID=A0AAP0K9J2_9MAGN
MAISIFPSKTLIYANPITPPPATNATPSLQPPHHLRRNPRRISCATTPPSAVEERPRFRWSEIGPNATEDQKRAVSQVSAKMTKRCKAVVKQIVCFDSENGDLRWLLAEWVRIMKPRRADWLVVIKELARMEHPLLMEVMEFALVEDSFEANVRDYTKIIDHYAKLNRIQDAENALRSMNKQGLACDQVTFTVLIQMYSKAGNFGRAAEIFEDLKLLGLPLDKRVYGSMIMAYIRAGMVERGEVLLREMEEQEIYAGSEVYKALLRAYSNVGESSGAQRVFDAIQCAGIAPDARICALLMNAYAVAGQNDNVRCVLENLRNAGIKPNDKCLAIMLAAYEKENKLNMALDLLMDLEKDGVIIGQEASGILAGWFRKLGVVEEVELVLREYATKDAFS